MSQTRKIKILFDAGPLVNGPRSGVGYYTQGLVLALATAYPEEVELVGHYFDFLGKKRGIALPEAANIRYRRTVLFPGKVVNALRRLGLSLPFEFMVKERGAFHLFPGFLGWPSLFKTPSTAVIHDLAYLEYPEYVSRRNQQDLVRFVPATIRRSSFTTTISRATEQKLQEHYGTLMKKTLITHIPPTIDIKISQAKARELVGKLGIQKKYVLFVGNIEPRKNIVGLLRAFAGLPDELRSTHSLVLAGGKGWNDDEILQTIDELKKQGHDIIQPGYVTDEERVALYMQATVFALPSFYEGFGMPVLEAMLYGTPVVVSNIPVLQEVAAEAALYCDPHDVASIATALARVLEDPALAKQLAKAGTARLKDFSWGKIAQDLYQAIAASLSR